MLHDFSDDNADHGSRTGDDDNDDVDAEVALLESLFADDDDTNSDDTSESDAELESLCRAFGLGHSSSSSSSSSSSPSSHFPKTPKRKRTGRHGGRGAKKHKSSAEKQALYRQQKRDTLEHNIDTMTSGADIHVRRLRKLVRRGQNSNVPVTLNKDGRPRKPYNRAHRSEKSSIKLRSTCL